MHIYICIYVYKSIETLFTYGTKPKCHEACHNRFEYNITRQESTTGVDAPSLDMSERIYYLIGQKNFPISGFVWSF